MACGWNISLRDPRGVGAMHVELLGKLTNIVPFKRDSFNRKIRLNQRLIFYFDFREGILPFFLK